MSNQEYFWQTPVMPTNGIWDQGKFINYSNVWRLGDMLVERAALQRKALALLFVENSVMSIAAYLGFLRAGHAVFLVDHRDSRKVQHALVEQYKPEVVWGSNIDAQSEGDYINHNFENTTLLRRHDSENSELHPDLALLLTTSGSTGDPKVARFSHQAVQANAASIVEALELDASERPITSLHMSFSYGLSIINSHLDCGASIACTSAGFQDDEFWNVVDEHDCTSIAGVPFQYNLLRQLGYWEDPKPTLKTYTQAGGALAAEQQEFHHQNATLAGAKFVVMYGQTEATARISVVPPESLNSHLGSIGLAIPGGQLSISNPDPQTGEGELIYKGPNVMLGYATNRENLSRGDELEGILHTGDLAIVDDKGYFWITGRLKRIVKPFGIRISLDHLERLTSKWSGCNTVVIGDDDKIIILVEGNDTALEGLLDRVADHIGLPESYLRVATVEKIPLDGRNKVDFEKIRQLVATLQLEGSAEPVQKTGKLNLEEQLLEIWSRLLKIKKVFPTDNIFLELGADSIIAVSALIEIESITGKELDLGDLFQHPTVARQVEFLSISDDGLSTGAAGDSLRTIVGQAENHQLLLFSASTGHEWMYLHLARGIADDVGIQVLRDWRLNEGQYVPQTIASLADWCFDRLSHEANIPPILGGYSFGGLLAYEVAVRLEQAGKPPEGIVLIDALFRPMLIRWLRRWVVKLLWHNAQHDYHLWNLPLLGKVFRPDEAAVRLLLSLSNREANYTTRPIGPMAEYVLGPDNGIDPELPIEEAFAALSDRMQEIADPEMVRRFVLPGVRPETALEHLLVFATNIMLNNDYVPSAPTGVPILFITPRQTPAHKIWRPYAQGQFDPYIVDGIRSQGFLNAHTNMVEPESVKTYQDELLRWVKDKVRG